MRNTKRKKSVAAKKMLACTAASVAVLGSAPASAFSIDTGDSDAMLRWDTTLRYTAGWRMEDINPHFANAFGSDESETRFKKHDLITNRVDMLTEMDYTVKRESGLSMGGRVSAALWAERAYPQTSHTSESINAAFPGAFAVPSNYGPGAKYSSYAKRFVTGNSGEILDAFVFGGFELGPTMLSLKLGKHNVYWGEAMFSIADGVSAGQQALDGIKGSATPGAETKELFMPLKQVSATWTLSPELSLIGQYQFEWQPFRVSPSGTYFGSDGGGNLLGADPMCAGVAPAGTCIRSLEAVTPKRSGGSFGVGARWSPSWLDGTAGLYYRKYDEKLPWAALQLAGGLAAFTATGPSPNNMGIRLSYARDTELLGLSLAKNFAAFSTGIDLSYRRNTALNSVGGFFAGSQGATSALGYFLTPAANIPLSQAPTYDQVEGARGNTYHIVVNGITLLDKNSLWETGNLVAELAYQRLSKVTKNSDLYYSVDYACKNGYVLGAVGGLGKSDGCATKDSLVFNLSFNPQWLGALPNTDLTVPISYSYGVFGNSPTLGGSNEGASRWSIGLTAVYRRVYEFGLLLSDQNTDYKTAVATAANGVPGQDVVSTSNGPSAGQNNHRWLSLRFKTAF